MCAARLKLQTRLSHSLVTNQPCRKAANTKCARKTRRTQSLTIHRRFAWATFFGHVLERAVISSRERGQNSGVQICAAETVPLLPARSSPWDYSW